MKKFFLVSLLFSLLFPVAVKAQSANPDAYWVLLTDKAGTTFDPYSYFDTKAIERYQLNGADLYDISNYPLNNSYVEQIDAIATDDFGQSRWLNAVAVTATPEQIAAIRELPFVKEILMLGGVMQPATAGKPETFELDEPTKSSLHNQLVRMGGQNFRDKGIDGKGVRIAVFDGGFPQVNTHAAFKHLRENHLIVKTWNFPNKKEDVYGWNSHGLMTLSCIAGRDGDMDLGFATGAEFLLARTEVEAEPKKEEVWWQMAVEWADKNGAQIISSSLGYGKDRYYTRDMNGQSLVAHAGNMAARKGMLVCNSAGNEGDDKTWRTIITPSDADSVLCVGGINPSLTSYERTSFSSYGPSADGRQKPNVTAFAYAWTANTGSGNDDYHQVPGTSFSCPLVAGFAACALQSRPGIKAMELFHEIERSGDLYPYCDYTYGYGVPQADYFTGGRKAVQPTFKYTMVEGNLRIVPVKDSEKSRLFIKNSKDDGSITVYKKLELNGFNTDKYVEVKEGDIITANLDGYTESYKYNKHEELVNAGDMELDYPDELDIPSSSSRDLTYDIPDEKKTKIDYFFMLGTAIKTSDNELANSIWSPSVRMGVRWTYYLAKAYGWGFGIEYGYSSYRYGDSPSNALETMIGFDALVDNADKIYKHRIMTDQLSAEIYQRVRFLPGGLMHKGLHWDLGVYVTISDNVYRLKYSNNTDLMAEERDYYLNNVYPLRGERLQYGVTTRFTNDIYGIYGRFNLHRLVKPITSNEVALPALEVGIQLTF